MRYVIKEKFFALGEDSTITDDSGNPVYQVDGKVLSLHDLLVINDMSGNEAGRVHRKLVAFVPTYEISVGGEDAAEVRKHFFSPIHDKFTIDVPGDDDLELSGDVFEHDYTVSRAGVTVATISKAWITWTATYGVDIAAGENDVLILATILALDLAEDREKKLMKQVLAVIMDMDGVVIEGNRLIPGAQEFIFHLQQKEIKYLILTNNSIYTARDLAARLSFLGLNVPADSLYTSALATARFLNDQHPKGSAFVVGEAGLTTALHEIGYTLTEHDPDYVVIGETRDYSFSQISRAVDLVAAGTRLIATNPDPVGPGTNGLIPATGALAALIARASGVDAYFVGKPNPLMLRTALRVLDVHSEEAVMVGDRMDTDIIMGVESGMETALVLTGVTSRQEVDRFPYQPSKIYNSIADLELAI